ncbi:NAD-binding protein [Candidatus Methylospira mobilis]|uniref:NAD-binding protein n=1 Tax=Candidatus Methylospira mobilis TaxID=1808979 RepID=UPI0028EBCDE9|nr:NAD-binding protein [Candidatus Methylospira mobilis]WNV06539.1 NAD-binding protein [Candidatus Methylospira mobilis]
MKVKIPLNITSRLADVIRANVGEKSFTRWQFMWTMTSPLFRAVRETVSNRSLRCWQSVDKAVDWVERHGLYIIAGLLLVSTLLWFAALKGSVPSRLIHGFLYSLQFIVLNKRVDDVQETLLRYGLYLPLFALPFFASIAFFGALFRERLVPFLQTREVATLNHHHVIVGYGAFGQALAKELGKNGRTVVGIDLPGSPAIPVANSILLRYDALHVPIVNKANMESAKCVYLLLPSERDNLRILEKITQQLQNKNVKVFLRTETNNMQRLIADWVGLKAFNLNTGLDIRPCSPIDIAARGVVNAYAPDLYAATDREGPIAQMVMVTGASAAAKALVLRLARIGVFSPQGKLQLVWAGEGVDKAYAEIAAIYPALETGFDRRQFWGAPADISRKYFDRVLPPIKIDILDSPAAHAIRGGALDHVCGARRPSVIYVCHESAVRNLAEARDLQAALCSHDTLMGEKESRQRLILAVQSPSVLGIGDGADVAVLNVLSYRIEEVSIDSVFANTVADDRADELAKGFDSAYAQRRKIDELAWVQKKFFLKESNRELADHLAIKARYSGIDAKKVADCVFKGTAAISDDDRKLMELHRDDLIAMEQLRYRAFMFMNGFAHGSRPEEEDEQKKFGKELDRSLRINATLLKENLSSAERVKDEDIIDVSLAALRLRSAENSR